MLPEVEAMRLAIVFEETGAYQYKKNREAESGSYGGGANDWHVQPGLKQGFEEDFSFGAEDNTDYWHFKDGGVEIVD